MSIKETGGLFGVLMKAIETSNGIAGAALTFMMGQGF